LNSKIVSNYRIVIPTLDGPYNIAKVPVPAEENLTHGIYDSSHNYLLQLTTTWRGSRNFYQLKICSLLPMQETFTYTLAETTLHIGWHQTAAYYQTTQLHLDSLPYSEGTI
jgi:hypothetical protein